MSPMIPPDFLNIGPEIVRKQLELIGENPKRDGLIDTPLRVTRAWWEMFSGYRIWDDAIKDMLTVFDEPGSDEIVILKNIEFYSMCEHHMLPFYGSASIGYIPDNGRIVGISKLARLLDVYSKRLQNQERLGSNVVDALMKHLSPKGCGCIIEAKHMCIACRGVQKQHSVMVTSVLRGCFKDDPACRSEFLLLAKE